MVKIDFKANAYPMISRLPVSETLDSLPDEWPDDPINDIRRMLARTRAKLAVLDDDPTGTQAVHDVAVLTDWSADAIVEELGSDLPALFLVTNSRSMPLAEAKAVTAEAGRNLHDAAARTGTRLDVVSRGDSTLRGHFPGESDVLAEALGGGHDAWILIPFFLEGGRYTINDVHSVSDGEWLTPTGETEFARDTTFAYRSSNLRQWVEEMTGGRVRAAEVASISIDDLRVGGPDRVAGILSELEGGRICIVNAASMRDLEVLTLSLLSVEEQGRRFLYRTAASFLRTRLGQRGRALLTAEDLGLPESGGALFVVGSHVPRTNGQLNELLRVSYVFGVEINVRELLSEASGPEIRRVADLANKHLARGQDIVIYTSRDVVLGGDAAENLAIGERIAGGVVEIVKAIEQRPRYIVAKGGTTASNVATQGLGVSRAIGIGQAFPGAPVWELGRESRFPGLKLVVFPGNVGGADALTQTLARLKT
ncbi:MAG: hypothetical protein CL694_07120 [Chloroflexi bacterium]|nr:hypothetical protein [Chloroflexota bacterium]